MVVMIILSNGLMVLTFVAAASAPLSHFVHLNFFPALLARHPRFNCHDAAAIVDCVAMVARPAEMVLMRRSFWIQFEPYKYKSFIKLSRYGGCTNHAR